MDVLLLTVAALTALVAGVTGAWSPCGFSMVDTLGSAAGDRGRRVMGLACATFTVGAIVGGVVTFGGLALIGALLEGAAGGAAVFVAVVVAAAAAVAEGLGWRIAPQIRRQVPEHWRRTMPLPLAAGLYGILLGLGFTTFVLTFAVWALAGISIALGSPVLGLMVGLGFGIGRAVPVVVMAPRLAGGGEQGAGDRMLMAMADRPGLLSGLRRLDALLLAALAVAIGVAPAAAQTVPLSGAAIDPAVVGDSAAWVAAGGAAHLLAPTGVTRIAGARAVALNTQVVVSEGELVGGRGIAVDARAGLPELIDRETVGGGTPPTVAQRPLAGVDALAASEGWVAWRRARPGGGDVIGVMRLPDLSGPRTVAVSRGVHQLGRPQLAGSQLVVASNGPRRSRILLFDLERGTQRVVRDSITLTQFRDPSLTVDGRLLFVEAGYCQQRLRLEPLTTPGRGRTLLRFGGTAVRDIGREPGRTTVGTSASGCPAAAPRRTREMLEATTVNGREGFVTVTRLGAGVDRARILRLPLPGVRLPVGG